MARFTRLAHGPSAETLLIGIISLALFYAFVLSLNYMRVGALLASPTIIHPAIKFVVGSPEYNVSDMLQVPVNQTFCPESEAVMKAAEANNRYLYYVPVVPGQVFRYSLIFNDSARTLEHATVMPPFRLISYSYAHQSRQDCANYPYSLGNATMTIQAPNSTYFGPVYAVMYFGSH